MSISSAAASATIQQPSVASYDLPKKGFRGFSGLKLSRVGLITGIGSSELTGNSKRFAGETGSFKFGCQLTQQHWNSSTEHGSNGAHNPLDSPPVYDEQMNGFECWG